MIPDYTIVVAVDHRTVEQFRLTWPTWKQKPGIADHGIVFIDDEAFYRTSPMNPSARHPWGWRIDLPQRERMLTAFVKLAPFIVNTPYWLKLDVDSIATDDQPWIKEEWFDGDPVLIARPWAYTKPGHWIETMRTWAAMHPIFGYYAPLDWPTHDPANEVYRHKRIISQQCFVNTEWSREVAGYCEDRLPIPSQDTYHWMIAEWQRKKIVRARFPGWTNRCTARGLKAAVEEALCST